MTHYGYGHDLFVFIPGIGAKPSLPEEIGLLKVTYYGKALTDYRGDICDIGGASYSVTTPDEPLGGVSFLKDAPIGQAQCPLHFPWMTDDEKHDVRFTVMAREYHDSFQALLERAMERSPLKKLYVRARCQGRVEQNNIIGTMSVKRFMEHIVRADMLMSNFTYVLADSADEALDNLINRAVAMQNPGEEFV